MPAGVGATARGADKHPPAGVGTPGPGRGVALRYRADIDGLRALAVLAVVFDHVGVRGMTGGFVGVDVFFVISGYLITAILAAAPLSGRAMIGFYQRRAARLLPALFAMLAAVTVAATLMLLPGELARHGAALAATALFASNLLFAGSDSYFAPASADKPLLHTWSLGVEEQFYLFWPLLLALAGARARAAVAAVTLGSLLLAVAAVARAPVAAFYLPPFRAWELGMGGLLALFPTRAAMRGWGRQAAGGAGLLLVAVPVARYGWATPFPGLAAVPPCLGAALLIAAEGSAVSRALAWRPLAAVGRLSYSLYLWHWPVILFARLGLLLPPGPAVKLGELAAAALLGWASWWLVERPGRRWANALPPRRLFALAAVASGVAVLVGFTLRASGGLPGRFTPAERALAATADMDGDRLYRGGRCFLVDAGDRFDAAHCLARSPGRRALLLAGDSHAAHLWPGLSALVAPRADVLQATAVGCAPLLAPAGGTARCTAFFADLFGRRLPRVAPDAVLLAARWRPADLAPLARTLADPRLRAFHPVLVGPVPQYLTALPRLLVRAARHGDPLLPARALDPEPFRLDAALRALARSSGTPYLSPIAALCAGGRCATLAAPGMPLQFDYGHLTPAGSRLLVARLLPALGAVLPSAAAPAEAGRGDPAGPVHRTGGRSVRAGWIPGHDIG